MGLGLVLGVGMGMGLVLGVGMGLGVGLGVTLQLQQGALACSSLRAASTTAASCAWGRVRRRCPGREAAARPWAWLLPSLASREEEEQEEEEEEQEEEKNKKKEEEQPGCCKTH